ncbi:putative Integral membrane sensor signal transduction histidine kinase [Candidatus Methylobacter favarea]|uniref:histidine kinase n=1 Tax=Candidatus Methylobacter favarea TaxID=2707345 RepID=A0A8S0Y5K8_9GAMM|nr:ATP-binding protein [Candidatus Methylobacter favarea]CAA9889298.1 putative Integral membrane sensor signal transduction histidine kinase [Candidatus Methylobacter favarea]
MKLPDIADTTSFKLSALYLGLFLLSFLAIGLTVYWLTTHTLEQQLKSGIEIEATMLKAEYDSDGLDELKEEIAGNDCMASHICGILDRNGVLIGGNFGGFKPSAGWQTIIRPAADTKPRREEMDVIYMKVIPLPDNVWLGVGHDGEYIRDAGEAIIQAFLWGIVLVITLGAGGGLYLSRTFLKKIEGITTSTEVIIAGDLKHRLPVAKNRDELDRLALLLNLMLDKIGELIENVQQVSNDIAHDLRTPLSHLKFRLENAVNRDLSAAQYRKQIALAIEEVDTILATFSALLRISQIESGSRRSGFKTVNLSDIVVSVAEALAPVAEEQGKTIHSAIDPDVTLSGDKELLTQLAFNLLDNAIAHTPENTLIELSLRSVGHRIELIIADNGPGIAEASRQKVLQRFYRLEQSRTTPGNGLGLSIVSAIADLHGGTLVLSDNHPGLKAAVIFCNRSCNSA